MAKVQITDTILRDGHQSQAATRMRTDEMLPACEMLDKVGYYSLECWGGATYDACLRFLNEDPWERLDLLREKIPGLGNISTRYVGPVIGAHCGPGTVAVCFFGKERPY